MQNQTKAEKLCAQFKAQPTPEPTLAQYIAAYIEEEAARSGNDNWFGASLFNIDSHMIQNAIDAYNGGAR